ncbi:unnamed protein product, partial [Symbiodinium necroappetens]
KKGHYANECWNPRVQQVQSQPCAGADGCPGDLPAAKQVVSAKVAAKPVDKATPKEKKWPPAMRQPAICFYRQR